MVKPPAMITLFGATGFTGQQIAAVLDQQHIPFRIAGRSAEKLKLLSTSLSSRPAWVTADAAKPATLAVLFAGSQVLINCAGPFTDLGEKVIIQAAMSGSAYLDVTNELGFYFRVRSYQEMAQRTGAVLVPACGFEVALADCGAAVIARKIATSGLRKHFDEINIIYHLAGLGGSRGTRRSAIRSLGTSWITYRNASWTGMIPGSEVREFTLPEGSQPAYLIPSCESATLPAHIQVDNVNVWMTTTHAKAFWTRLLLPLLARASRSILRDPILAIAGSGGMNAPAAGTAVEKGASSFKIRIQLSQGKKQHWMTISGQDPYLLTAQLAAYAAQQLLSTPRPQSGLLSPAQALDPQGLFDTAVKHWNITLDEGCEGD
jgi:short subunit dehydrogenase-like uncharacterized protein